MRKESQEGGKDGKNFGASSPGSYLQVDGSPIVQALFWHAAGKRQVGPLMTLHEAPSAATAEHVPICGNFALHTLPAMHRVGLPLTDPHGAPLVAVPTFEQSFVPTSQQSESAREHASSTMR
jgi:hypothetical protein